MRKLWLTVEWMSSPAGLATETQTNGVDFATMGKILGHRDIETTIIYTHQTQEHLKKSIEKIDIK